MKQFLANEVREAMVPIVDEEDMQNGGARLMGFVMIQCNSQRS